MMTGFQYYIILWQSHEQFDNITRTWLKILVFEQQRKPFITPKRSRKARLVGWMGYTMNN